jgi:hypothetical protein
VTYAHVYLEEVEENLRAVLTSKTNTAYREAGSFDEQLDRAAEELLTGDSDDPPLSEKTITEMPSWLLLRGSSRYASAQDIDQIIWFLRPSKVAATQSQRLGDGYASGSAAPGWLASP